MSEKGTSNLYFNTVKTHRDCIDEKARKKLQYLSINIYTRERTFLRQSEIKYPDFFCVEGKGLVKVTSTAENSEGFELAATLLEDYSRALPQHSGSSVRERKRKVALGVS